MFRGLSRQATLRCFSTIPQRARVIVVGCGRMGQIRASLIRSSPCFELAGIVDPNIEGAMNLAMKHGVSSYSPKKKERDARLRKRRHLRVNDES